ncbi:CGNR zinc finger domain-containing protein [Caulobacter soli]|uniref:CGNR zinc finger domain-containing protein n=1 Tax=Caulobacter soli TaxID=2708539 RepID=UPI0013ED85D5|nr:ABATE domain-containing protein [Caulobacter soli]
MTGKAEIRDGFKFRGGSPALDLAATMVGRLGAAPRDLLATAADLDRWLVAAELARVPPGSTEGNLVQARSLREALYRLALSRAEGAALPDADRDLLNAYAALPAAPLQLGPDGRARLSGDVRGLLAELAREGVSLLGGDFGDRIRQCEGPPCAVLFVDISRKGDRRWCSMSACGNKAKVAGFRARERSQ